MPLTTNGICVQILASVQAFRVHEQICSTNDCKVVLTHLVRKFSEPLSREGKQRRLVSKQVGNGQTDDTVEDHAVPVIVIVEEILRLPSPDIEITETNISKLKLFLVNSLLLVEITREEDLNLCARGFQRCMPKGWALANSGSDQLARYREANIDV
jgi:hypothetical protein